MTLPKKTRELHNHHFDSTVWNEFKIRDNDIIISTYGKSGTTWMQQIIGQMLLGPDPDLAVGELSPWVDFRVPPKEVKIPMIEGQTHRRFLKTHLPVDALVFSSQAKYIYIGRDARDVVWSLYNHHVTANQDWYNALNKSPGLVGPPIEAPPKDVFQYWKDWLEKDGFPFWSFWENAKSWWDIRNRPNVYFIHFNNLKKDMSKEMKKLASFLGISVKKENWETILEYCSFDWMKAHAPKVAPLGGSLWEGGAQSFIHKGTNGRWKDTLTSEDIKKYENRGLNELGEDCLKWFSTGEGLD